MSANDVDSTYYLVRMNGKKQRFYAKFENKQTSVDLESVGTSSSSEEKKQEIAVKPSDDEKQGMFDSFPVLVQIMDKLSIDFGTTSNAPVSL